MLIASICIGDTLVTLVHADHSEQDKPDTYDLFFRDIPSGKTDGLSFTSKREAIFTFAAWIAAHNIGMWPGKQIPNTQWFHDAITDLQARMVTDTLEYFLP